MEFFKKKDAVPSTPEPPAPAYAPRPASPPPPAPAPAPAPVPAPPVEAKHQPAPPAAAPQRAAASSSTLLGASITVRGDIIAEENVTIEGAVDGTIETSRDVIVAPQGRVKANIRAATVSIAGRVKGNVVATIKVDLTASGQLEGNIHAPKLAIAESALFKGSIDMSAPGERKAAEPSSKESSKK